MVGVITICFVTRCSSLWNEVEIVIEMLSIGGGSLETWREVGKKLDVPWKIWKVGRRGVVFGEMLSN